MVLTVLKESVIISLISKEKSLWKEQLQLVRCFNFKVIGYLNVKILAH